MASNASNVRNQKVFQNSKKNCRSFHLRDSDYNKENLNIKNCLNECKSHKNCSNLEDDSTVAAPSVFKTNTSKRNNSNEQTKTQIINNLPCEIKSHFNSLRIDFTPNEADNKDFKKCQSLLKLLSKKFDAKINIGQVLPTETVLASNENHQNAETHKTTSQDEKIHINKKPVFSNTNTTNKTKNKFDSILRTLETTATEMKRFTTSNAVNLCTQLDKWDKQHPKSMDPPGPVPTLTHAILQRIKQER